MNQKRCVVVSAWLPREVAELIQSIADMERRSRSNVVRNLLLDTFGAQVMNGKLNDEEEKEKEA